MIYVNLNKCIVRDNFIDGEVWIPENKFNVSTHLINLVNTSQNARNTTRK